MWVVLGTAYLLQIPPEREWPGEPFLLFLLVVIGTTLCLGARLGFVSAALSAFLCLYFFEPVGSPMLRDTSDLNRIALYAIIAFSCVVCVARLIDALSERERAEQDRQRLAAIVASSVDAIISKDLNGVLTSWNPGAEQLFGYAPAEMIGRPITLLIPARLWDEEANILKRIADGERIEHFETTRVRKDGRLVQVSLSISPIRNAQGSVVGASTIARDITHFKHAEQALAERNAQFALAGKILLIGSFMYDDRTKRLQLSPGAAAIYGLPEGTLEISREEWRALVHPDDLPQLDAIARRAFTNGERECVLVFRILRHGQMRWIESRVLIQYNEAAKPLRRIGAQIDVTERKQAEQKLIERDLQLTLAARAGLVGTYAYDVDREIMQISPGYAAIHGFPEGTSEIARSKCLAGVHVDDLKKVEQSRSEAFRTHQREYNVEYRIIRSGSELRWVETRCFLSYDTQGEPYRVVGVSIDVTERKRVEEHHRTLLAELDHRVKNALATVSAVVAQTQQGSGSAADFVAALNGRIRSMATTHELLSSHRWHGVSLMELARRELAPYAIRDNTVITGPAVVLKPEAGQAMAMVLHELATNAAKYGALSSDNGRVKIRWHCHSKGRPHSRLVLKWQEIGGPAIVAMGNSGYGTSTIRDLIPYEFGGTVELVLAQQGARCRIELPANWLASEVPQTVAHASDHSEPESPVIGIGHRPQPAVSHRELRAHERT
jgi:PAS domain S-box-containing protein